MAAFCAIVCFLLLCCAVESAPTSACLKQRLRDRSLGSALRAPGRRGRMMRMMGLAHVLPRKLTASADSAAGEPSNRTDLLPPAGEIARGLPVLSVLVDPVDLYDERSGIFRRCSKRGRKWERPCFIEYYRKGELLFSSGAGVRLHGGKSRLDDVKSIRLFLRSSYGHDCFAPGILFGGRGDPVRHLVVRNEMRDGYDLINHLAFRISRRIGCLAPHTQPVLLYLNGARHGHGVFLASEHISPQYLAAHFGHDDFVFVRTKSRQGMAEEYKVFARWVRNTPGPLTMDRVKEHVDFDNLCAWWAAQLFCGNTDMFQGIALLDRKAPDAKWFYVNWDMDHSFRNARGTRADNIWEQRDFFVEIARPAEKGPRARIFCRLREEDPEFCPYFERYMAETLDRRLTTAFLEEAVQEYEDLAEAFGIEDREYVAETRRFIRNRPAFVRKLIRKYMPFRANRD